MSMASTDRSQASSDISKASFDTSVQEPARRERQRSQNDILLFLVALRIVNAFCVRTFFQPDEFFQSLEPAWQLVFGSDSGAWITWEWRHHLRSSLHPIIFAGSYYVAKSLARCLPLSPLTRADLLIAAPKTTQAVIAAVGDYYTWKLAGRVYGRQSREAWTALALTVVSPWQWFCSTRTLSNCLETTLTVVALYLWPWQWSLSARDDGEIDQNELRTVSELDDGPTARGELTGLRQCLLLAALACILRPTNILIWITLASFTLRRGTAAERVTLVREAVICGSAVLGFSAFIDRLYYGSWTFPPLKFLYFNVAQSLAVFYGRNDWHYYVSQGYPLLLTTALPFALVGLYQALFPSVSPASNPLQTSIKRQLASVCLVMPFVLSLISHKEVRFIYPLLPPLHVLTSQPVLKYFYPAITTSARAQTPRRLILLFLLLVNGVVAFYTTLSHASGALNTLAYLRGQHQIHYQAQSQPPTSSHLSPISPGATQNAMTVGFLMPCHSTPWRSHLVFPSIHAWALSCEPPVGLNETQKASYLDEADQFYDNPASFLRQNMLGGLRHLPHKPTYLSSPLSSSLSIQPSPAPQTSPTTSGGGNRVTHPWPDYLIFFAQLEPTLQSLLRPSSYAECWRTWNTAWHDDWRRRGDIVVWCLDPAEQSKWRSRNRRMELERRDRQFDRIIEAFRREAAVRGWPGNNGTGKESFLNSLWRRLKGPSTTTTTSSSWQWPWRERKKSLVSGFHLPSWLSSSSSGNSKKSGSWWERRLWS